MKKFRKGQLIIHPQQGVFKLERFKKREIEDQKDFYLVLKPFFKSRSGLKVFIPEELAEKVGLRRIAKKGEILRALRGAARFLKNNLGKEMDDSEEDFENWVREREFKKSLILLGYLYYRMKILKQMRMSERQLYKKALLLLSEELAAAKRCSKKHAQKEIFNHFRAVFKKRKEDS